MGYQTFVKSPYIGQPIASILTGPPNVLLGVSDAAAAAIAALSVQTVFDLSVATVFDNAARIVASADNPRSVMRRYGRGPSSVVDDGAAGTVTDQLPYADIVALAGIDAATAGTLRQELSVKTIRDLALWPPFLAAKAIMLEAYNPLVGGDADPEMPVTLVPKSGEFGTERHLYSTVVMFPGPFERPPTTLKGVLFDMTAAPEIGFDMMRYGARLTYSHNWNPVAVAKGHLLHSLPLAPGESTNVAVIDWTNKSSASTQQSLSESERLASSNDRARTVSQIASGVATEFTQGASVTATESTSTEGSVGGIAGFLAGSVSGAVNQQTAATHTVSTGDRTIATKLQQNIQDATQQVSSSLRNQRAATVSEVNQAQSENLSTRTVTNYNHMHALTVQYYEVVQVYETETRLEDAERCIFLPMRPISFTDERNILRYLTILKASALDGLTRSLLADLEENAALGYGLTFANPIGTRLPQIPANSILTGFIPPLDTTVRPALDANARTLARDGFLFYGGDLDRFTLDYRLQLNAVRWSPARLNAPNTPITRVDILREDGTTVSINQSAPDGASPSIVDTAVDGGSPLSFGRIAAISVQMNPAYQLAPYPPVPDGHLIRLELAVGLGNEARWLDLSFLVDLNVTSYGTVPLYTVSTPPALAQLGALLNENRLYYSQQIWLREDPQTRIMQLAPFQLKVGANWLNLVDYLSPQPLQVVGNYLVYRFTYENDRDWQLWVKDHVNRSHVDVDTVAVPTGGVFAEAVLSRANGAEKLDITRFFDWQDSPPPAPPAIQALTAGTHTPAAAAELGTLDKPLVSIQAPVALPDPTGLSSVLTAIATSDAFRNMSGLTASGEAATSALDASGKAATGSLQAAGAALATTLNALAEALAAKKDADKSMSDAGAAINSKAATEKADAEKDKDGKKPSDGDKAKEALANKALANQGLNGKAPTAGAAGPPPTSSDSDPAILDSKLITEPTFSNVLGFVKMLQLLSDTDIVNVVGQRLGNLDPTVDPMQKYAEFVDVVTKHSANLENPARFLYAGAFVKTGVLPSDADYIAADVAGVRAAALTVAVRRTLPVAHTVNGAATAETALTAILGACAARGVADLDPVAYILATAHHESAMGRYTTEIANGVSTDTVFTRDAYFFNAIPGKKVSYNTFGGNIPAGNALRDAGTVTAPGDVTVWNGTAYPDGQPAAVKRAARTCDFLVFIGRGYVQITGRANYHQFSNLPTLGTVDLEANPDRASEPDIAAGIMVLGMRDGLFRGGHKLADYDLATTWDATHARNIVNGDVATYGAAIREHAKKYKTALIQVLKLDESKALV
jgi:hypothetical protein